MSEKPKPLLELLRNRPRWTRFQNFDVEESNAGLEKCLEEIEFAVEGLVAELQNMKPEHVLWKIKLNKEKRELMMYGFGLAKNQFLVLLGVKDAVEGKSFLEKSQDYADRLEKEKQKP